MAEENNNSIKSEPPKTSVETDQVQSKREERKEQRLEQRLSRDIKRGRLSWKTKQALEEKNLLDFAKSLLQEKSNNAKMQDSKESAQESGAPLSTTRTQVSTFTTTPTQSIIPSVPYDLPSEIVQVCVDGRPALMRVYGGIEEYL
jgi:hypothetical protein